MTEPCDLTATEARRLIGRKKLSPIELMTSCIDRIGKVNGKVNAVVALDAERALAEARRAEADVMAGNPLGALAGLPIGVKDLDSTAGLRTTWGSLLFKDFVPEADDPVVANIRKAGGIVLCKTNTPEFGAGANTVNRVYGATGNPFDVTLSVAGSSGGSAAALATGMVPLATGSDMGGSLRTPAGFCGVVGFRPSPGLVPDPSSGVALSPFAVLGPMGRTVDDAHLLLMAQLDVDRRDAWSSSDAHAIPCALQGADLSRLRVAFSVDLGVAPIDNNIRDVFAAKTARFKHLFAKSRVQHPWMADVHDAFEVLRGIGFVASFRELVAEERDLLGENVIDNTERALKWSLPDVAAAHKVQTVIYRSFINFFHDVDILIAPAAAVSPFPHAQRYVTHINGEEMPTYMSWLAVVYGLTMALPAVACIPCGRDHKGLPFGIQVAGPRGSDAKVLAIAKSLSEALEGDVETARPVPDLAKLTS